MIHAPKYDVKSDWRPTPVSKLPSWEGVRRVGIDVETHDEDLAGPRRGGYVVGISLALQDGIAANARKFYLPIRHEGGDNLDPGHVISYLKEGSSTFPGEVVGANLPYDLDHLWALGVRFPRAAFHRDVQVAEPLLDELQFTYSLADAAERNGFEGKNEEHLNAAARRRYLHPKKDLWRLAARHVGAYAEDDAALPLKILEVQEKKIGDQDLWEIFNLESRVLPVLVRMRERGVRVDERRLELVERFAEIEERKALEVVKASTGVEIPYDSVWEAEPVERALRATGWAPKKTTTKGACLDAEVLKGIDHDVARAIARARKVNKLRTTFAASVRRYMVKGRIHTTFNQLRYQKDEGDLGGAAYGRLSSVDPNLQQQPARDEEIGPFWRAIYVPDEGGEWAACDYSAQEPRWTVHYANRIGAPGAAALVAAYHADPKLDLHQKTADLASIKRKDAKTIFLGLCYGMGGAKLCRSLGLPVERKTRRELGWSDHGKREGWLDEKVEVPGPEGLAFLSKFNDLVPFVKFLAKAAERKASSRGYVTTALGRRCRFPAVGSRYDWTHKALNRIIQGSSADQTKKALVDLDAAGIPVQLQVHDEIDLTVWERSTAERVAEIMATCVPMDVPCVVDLELGASWGESMGAKFKVPEAVKEDWR